MKIISKHNTLQKNNKPESQNSAKKNKPSFGNGAMVLNTVGKGLQYLDANPVAGVTFLDLSTAIGPNTIIDAKKRNPVQAFETFRRESSGLIINCLLPGVAAGLVGKLIKKNSLDQEFKSINAHQIWAGKDSIEDAAESWKKLNTLNKEKKVEAFVEQALDKIEPNKASKIGLNPNDQKSNALLRGAKKKLSKAIIEANDNNLKIPKKTLLEVNDDLAKVYGETKSITINGNKKVFSSSLKNYVRNTFSLAKAFTHKSVNNSNIDKFSSNLKGLLKKKSGITMLGIGALALGMQKINREITEKVSGKKGYQGYSDNSVYIPPSKEEKKELFKQKALSVGWFTALTAAAMGKPVAKMFHFVSPQTTINQARTFALLTNTGRIAAAEDSNELKDSRLRDTMIFLNLYVLGDYVSKGVVSAAQKIYKKKNIDLNLLNEGKKLDKNTSPLKKALNWVRGKSVKSFEEIEGTASNAPKKLRKKIVTIANLSGIGYSLVALGIIMPMMIAKMTQKNREKQLEQLNLSKNEADAKIPMTGKFSTQETQKLFKAFKS